MPHQHGSSIGCIECTTWLDQKVYYYSLQKFGVPLCRIHQNWIRSINSTENTKELYFALRERGVPATLEKYDGHKTIDIAIVDSKVNIEVDGKHHTFNPNQALTDLQRTYYSFLKGYITLRIPNSLIESNLDNTVEYIVKFLNANGIKRWQ